MPAQPRPGPVLCAAGLSVPQGGKQFAESDHPVREGLCSPCFVQRRAA